VTAGTFGVVVRDRATNARLILSNNHVLANSNDALIGDPILQPGAADGGQNPQDIIARLERFQPIQFSTEPGTCNVAQGAASIANLFARVLGSKHQLQAFKNDLQASNLVDAAVARPLEDDLIQDEIVDIGVVQGTAPAELLMSVRKSGRSTGLTTGEITVLDATVNVSYGVGRTVRFEDQIISGPMSAPGDSGSLLVAGDSLRAVGLLFAGSDEATIYNPIQLAGAPESLWPGDESMSADDQSIYERIRAVKKAYEKELMDKANVVGVGIGLRRQGGMRTDEVALVVMVRQKVPLDQLSPDDVIPGEIEGVIVDVQEVGDIGIQN
jgi:hypothetical protein